MQFATSLVAMLVLAISALCQGYPEMPLRGDAKVRLGAVHPVAYQSMLATGEIMTTHEDGLVALFGVSDDGDLCVSFYTNSTTHAVVPQGPLGQEPVPLLRTNWCDEKGVTHEVVTPIVSSTDGGVAKARALHRKLVEMEQADFPPKKCPQPPQKVGELLLPRLRLLVA